MWLELGFTVVYKGTASNRRIDMMGSIAFCDEEHRNASTNTPQSQGNAVNDIESAAMVENSGGRSDISVDSSKANYANHLLKALSLDIGTHLDSRPQSPGSVAFSDQPGSVAFSDHRPQSAGSTTLSDHRPQSAGSVALSDQRPQQVGSSDRQHSTGSVAFSDQRPQSAGSIALSDHRPPSAGSIALSDRQYPTGSVTRHDHRPQSPGSIALSDRQFSTGSFQIPGSVTADVEAGTMVECDLSLDISKFAPSSMSSGLSLSSPEQSQASFSANGEHIYPDSLLDRDHSPLKGRQAFEIEMQPTDIYNMNMPSSQKVRWGHDQRPVSPAKSVQSAKSSGTAETSADSPSKSPKRRVKSIRFSSENEIRTYTPNPEEFIDNPQDLFGQSQSCASRMRHFLAMSVLPLTYGVSSNLSSLFFVFELLVRYKGKREIVGIYLVAAYLTRVLMNALSRYSPKTFVFFGSIASLAGNALIFISQNPKFLGLQDITNFDDDGLNMFIIGGILTSCNETIGAMQMFVREQSLDNVKHIGMQLRIQYLLSKFARIGAYAGGGILYHSYGVHGIAVLGGGSILLQILALVCYMILDAYRIPHDPNNAFGDEYIPATPDCRPSCSIRASRGRRRMFKSSMSKLNRTLAKYYPLDILPSSVRYLAPACIFGRTLSSICIWSSSTVILVEDFEQNLVAVGIIFAGAAAADFLVSYFSLTEAWFKRKWLIQSYLHVCLGGITFSSIAVATPNFAVYVAGFMVFMVFNAALRIAVIELQGSNMNSMESFTVQMMRRIWTVAALYCIPLIYRFHPRLPLILALWFNIVTSIGVAFCLSCCGNSEEMKQLDNNFLKRKRSDRPPSRSRQSRKPERNLLYAERVMLGRLIKGKDV